MKETCNKCIYWENKGIDGKDTGRCKSTSKASFGDHVTDGDMTCLAFKETLMQKLLGVLLEPVERFKWWIKRNVIHRYQSWVVINKLLKPSMATKRSHADKYGTEFGTCWFFRSGDYAAKAGIEYNLYFLMRYKPVDAPEYGVIKSSDGKWYGYSFRAIFGFKVGDKITKSSSAYIPSTVKEIIEQHYSFNKGWKKYFSNVIEHSDRLELHTRMSQCSLKEKCPNMKKDTYDSNHVCEWIDAEPEVSFIYTGKGEHTIKSDAEAYDAAKKFSEGVS